MNKIETVKSSERNQEMNRSRFGLLGLCAVLFGIMAFGASAAQAEAGSHFWILNSSGTKIDAGSLHATIGLKKDTAVNILHSKILGVAVLFLCTELEAQNATLEGEGKISSGGKVLFTGCTTDLNGTANAACTPKDATTGVEGTILTQPLHSLVILGTGGETLLNILPDKEETFANIEMGSKCPIGTKVPVIGKLALKDCEGKATTHLEKHLVEPAPAPFTELWTISKTVEHQATLLGSAWGFLTGEHATLLFGAEAA
jgi:hypothetical protein